MMHPALKREYFHLWTPASNGAFHTRSNFLFLFSHTLGYII